jgi:hypothetical protein
MRTTPCKACAAVQWRWRETRPSQFGGIRFGAGAMYDFTAAGATANARRRYDEWAALVRQQCDAIAALCASGTHQAEPTEGGAP